MSRKTIRSLFVDRDKLNHAHRNKVASACIRAIDRIQHLPREEQVLGLASAFLLLCTVANIPAQDAFTVVKNLMHDPLTSSGLAPQFQGVRAYLRDELA